MPTRRGRFEQCYGFVVWTTLLPPEKCYNTKMDEKHYKMIKGTIRKDHFAAGGTPTDWRGISNVYTDRKKRENKEKCRKEDAEDQ